MAGSVEWFAPWKSIDGLSVEANTTGSMKALAEGLLRKDRLLAYIRDFIVFEQVNEKIAKKAAKYHQFFAVQIAAARAVASFTSSSSSRIGVIWHTTGSGKSLSMAFLVGILRQTPELRNPAIIIQVDATDLDDQLYDQFVAARALVGDAQHAERIEDLRRLLRTEGGELIFSTLQKFQLKEGGTSPTRCLQIVRMFSSSPTRHIEASTDSSRAMHVTYVTRCQMPSSWVSPVPRSVSRARTQPRCSGTSSTPTTYGSRRSMSDSADFYEPRQVQLHLSANTSTRR